MLPPQPVATEPEKPLLGLRVLVTRPEDQAPPWLDALREAGADALAYPTIQVAAPPTWEPLDEVIGQMDSYDWVVFTSAAAVRNTVPRVPTPLLGVLGRRPRVAAVGVETARALERLGVPVAVVPDDQRQEGLLVALGALSPGTRVLFPQALGGRETLRNELARRGCTVDVVPASQTLPIQPLGPPPPFDVATFASPSALRAFIAGNGLSALVDRDIVVLGPTTEAAARALGLRPAVAAAPHIDALIHAIAPFRR